MEKHSPQSVYEVLNMLGIQFKAICHRGVETMGDCEVIGHILGAPFCKNLFLMNRQGTEFFLLLIDKDKRFKTADVSKKIGKARLSFGTEEMLSYCLGVSPGAISPMGLIHDKERMVRLLVDRDVAKLPAFCVHPCVNTESLVLSAGDFFDKFLRYTGHRPHFLEI